MRNYLLSLFILLLPTVASGQLPKEKLKEHPTLKIVGFQWLAYEGGSVVDNWASGPAVTSVAGAISLGVSPMNATGDGRVIYIASTSVREFSRPPDKATFKCTAVMTLHNAGTKPIRAVLMEYIFRDQDSGVVFLRYQFRANQKIGPGKTKRLKQNIYQKFGKYRKAFLPIKPTPDVVLRTREAATFLLIRQIEYSDGTVQQY